jgi:RNA polymerase sigma factor (sigma-70 family)
MLSIKESWTITIQSRSNIKTRQQLFNKIWQTYHKRLFFFIRNIAPNDAEDLLQEVMLKVYQNLEKYNPFYAFNTWIYTIARNHCINFINKRKLTTQSMNAMEENERFKTSNETPESQLLSQEMNKQIEQVLLGFESEFREIAYLRFYEGMACRNIAKIMNIPNGTVKSRLHGIRQKIKKVLETYHAA